MQQHVLWHEPWSSMTSHWCCMSFTADDCMLVTKVDNTFGMLRVTALRTALAQGSRASPVPVVCADLRLPLRHCVSLPCWDHPISLAVEHINTSDQPRYWYHPRIVRLSVIGHSQRLLHGPRTLYCNTFGTQLLFPSSAKNWRPVRHCFHHVLAATDWFYWHCTVVLQQQCDNAT